jgi:hypothetical protein
MKTFYTQAAQGDTLYLRVDELPAGVVPVVPEAGRVVVAHSETGHHHVMEAEHVTMYRLPEEIYECFLHVKEPTELRHLRPHETHESILFSPGVYRVRRQREYVPEGWRRVED